MRLRATVWKPLSIAMHEYDKCGKYQIQHHGDSILRMARARAILCTTWDASWRIIKLWEVPADDLLATGDVGVVPWVPLARFDGPPEPIIRECRARIEQVGSRVEKENLLAVTQFLARLRYNIMTKHCSRSWEGVKP